MQPFSHVVEVGERSFFFQFLCHISQVVFIFPFVIRLIRTDTLCQAEFVLKLLNSRSFVPVLCDQLVSQILFNLGKYFFHFLESRPLIDAVSQHFRYQFFPFRMQFFWNLNFVWILSEASHFSKKLGFLLNMFKHFLSCQHLI